MGNLGFPTKHVQEKTFPQQHKASKVNNSMASPWLQHGPLATAPITVPSPDARRRVVLEAFHRFFDQRLLPLQRRFQDLDLRSIRAQGDLRDPGDPGEIRGSPGHPIWIPMAPQAPRGW